MGGDGGVIASNRRYMRGAGTADCTADYHSKNGGGGNSNNADTSTNAKAEAARRFRTCALTGQPLRFDEPHAIVTCPYGMLYHKEAAVEALLSRRMKRKQQQQQQQPESTAGTDYELGSHIRGLKDLYEVRFNISKDKDGSKNSVVITCPITNIELNGQVTAYALIPGASGGQPNVVSERAMKELGEDVVFADQGGGDDSSDGSVKKIRLVPPTDALDAIKESLQKQRETEAADSSEKKAASSKKKKDKKKSKKDKKRKHSGTVAAETAAAEAAAGSTTTESNRSKSKRVEGSKGSIADLARSKVSTAVKQNQVLSSLFQSTGTATEKEQKDNLFAR